MRKPYRHEKFSPVELPLQENHMHLRIGYLIAFAAMLLLLLGASILSFAGSSSAENAAADIEEPAGTAADTDISTPVYLSSGDRGEEVLLLQKQLTMLGYDVGTIDGIYTLSTASAVRAFQEDSGFHADGVCTAAVSSAIAYLSDTDLDVSVPALQHALKDAGCYQGEIHENAVQLNGETRNALILFQRTHGLCGTGTPGYATLCALGMETGTPFPLLDTDNAADAALYDLRCRMLSRALAVFVHAYPKAEDLYTLTCCAAVLCSRVSDPRFPSSFDAVCAAGLLYGDAAHTAPAFDAVVIPPGKEMLLLRAAEDALRMTAHSSDIARGALYVCRTGDALPDDAVICVRTSNFIFYR